MISGPLPLNSPGLRRNLFQRNWLCALIASAPDCEQVGEASSDKEAVNLAVNKQPDVILMDLKMPDMDGIQATR